ncbi:MAG: PD40 domain-containing protein [Acidobacteria bacterium]|nr:PD40 domain-containing protein [Acidobacteriota bacterium]
MRLPQPISPRPMPPAPPGDLLETWKEIAAYLSRDVRTVKRWEDSRGLPVHRLPGGPKSAVYALRSEVDAWRQGAGTALEKDEHAESPRGPSRIHWIAAAAALAAIAALALWRVAGTRATPLPRSSFLTNYSGLEWFAAFSPDGKQVAFSWNGEHEDNDDIYVKQVNLGNPLRLTTHPAMDLSPAWSPDGRYIAFARWDISAAKLKYFVIPSLGGVERHIIDDAVTPNALGFFFPVLAWSPDGKRLMMASSAAGPYRLILVSPDTRETMPLTSPPPTSPGDCCPAVSPDGRALAFLRASAARTYQPMVLEISPNGDAVGAPRKLESPPCANPFWSAGSSELFCVADGEQRVLWRIPIRNRGAARPVPSIGLLGQQFSITPRGNRLVYSNLSWEVDIWRMNLSHNGGRSRLIASTAEDLRPAFSPDGTQLAFLSKRSGHLAIWVSDSNGANASELARTAAPHAPSWSPDGQQIAFTCRTGEGTEDICTIASAQGNSRQLTKHPARDIMPHWSHDGRWIYFTSDRGGSFQIWKTPAEGAGDAVRVTQGGGFGAMESADGRFLYYSRTAISGSVWRVPAQGGDEVPLDDSVRSLRLPQNFAVGKRGIYFASSPDPARQFELRFYSFATRTAEPIARIEGGLGNGMALSPDGETLAFTLERRSGDLVMVENFQ